VALLHATRGEPLGEVLVLAIGLAVAAVPEGLPAVVTIALALGMRRLVERNALVRKLPAVEALGSVTVICTDKTGTLTRNQMTVREIRTASATFQVTGSGYAPSGEFVRRDGTRARAVEEPELARALGIGARCNNARVEPAGSPEGAWTVIGDPTEGALLIAALKGGVPLALDDGERIAFEIPFDSERRRMSVAVASSRGTLVHAKGAAEALLPRCASILRGDAIEPLGDLERAEIFDWSAEMGRRALRVLALAFRADHAVPEHAEEELVFVALVGMQDPPREEVPAAVATCVDAGIRPVMITGDQAGTALAIAREIGLARGADRATTGAEIDGWSDADLADAIESCPVIARASAEHKLRVVRAWRARGHVVAMTGDGVNDAPALQEADIGVAMGVTGTDVTREAADMVLVDDNFASIVAAVREGRGIFDNVRKFVHYLLTANAAEVMTMLGAAWLAWPAPLNAIQLLWMNLVTDGLPALALGIEPTEPDVMRRRPLARGAPVVSIADARSIFLRGALLTLSTAVAYRMALGSGDVPRASAIAFAVLVFGQLAYVFAFRSRTATLPQLGVASNWRLVAAVAAACVLQALVHALPPLREVFSIHALAAQDWFVIAAFGLAPVTSVEIAKLARRPRASRERAPRIR
jgi:Ca2+-transporting ATPase